MAGLAPRSRNRGSDGFVSEWLYVSVHTVDPGENDTTSAPELGSRAAVTWGAAVNGIATQSNTANITVTSGTVVNYVSYWDAATGGNYQGGKEITQVTSDGIITLENLEVETDAGVSVAFAVQDQSIDRGTLTLAGAGGHSFSALIGTIESIGTVTGSNAADWAVTLSSGTVTAVPASNGLSNGPYSLTIPCYPGAGQTGTPINVTFACSTTAGVMSVISEAEANAALASATSNNNTVRFERATYPPMTINAVSKTSTTLTTATGAQVSKVDFAGVSGVTVAMTFVNNVATGADDSTLTNGTQDIVFINGGSVIFDGSTISNAESIDKTRRYGGVRTTNGTALAVNNSEIHHVYDAIVANNCTGTALIGTNDLHHIRIDAITGRETYNWIVAANEAYHFQGNLGRRLNYTTSSGTINVGDFIRTGSGPDNYSGGLVRAVTGTHVDIWYNAWEAVQAGQTLTVVGGSASITVDTVTSDFDGNHGNFLQVLANGAVQNIAIQVRGNFVHRATPFVHGELDDENLVEAVRIQNAVLPIRFNPVIIENNVFSGGMPDALVVDSVINAVLKYNTVLTPIYSGADSPNRIRLTNSEDVVAHHNTADGAGNTIIESGNTNTELFDNTDVPKANFNVQFADPLADPANELADFAPVSGQTVDTNDAGALTIGGVFKTILPLVYDVNVTPTSDGATVDYSVDQFDGTTYILMDQNATRTPAQIVAGGGVDSDNAVITNVGDQVDFVLTGGSSNTAYNYHIVHQALDGTFSSVVEAQFTTSPPATVAPSVVGTVTTTPDASGGNSTTLAYTVGSGSNRKLVVCVTWEQTSGVVSNPAAITATYAGTSMTNLGGTTATVNNFNGSVMFELEEASLSTGSNNIGIGWPVANVANVTVTPITVQDTHQTNGPTVATAQAVSTTISNSITPAVDDSLIIDSATASFDDLSPTAGAGQTLLDSAVSSFTMTGGASSKVQNASATTMSWTFATSGRLASVASSFRPV